MVYILQDDSKSSVTPSPSPDKRDWSPERAVSPPFTTDLTLPNGSSQPPSPVSSAHSPRRIDNCSPDKSEVTFFIMKKKNIKKKWRKTCIYFQDSMLCEMRTPDLPTMCPLSPYSSSTSLPVPSLLAASRQCTVYGVQCIVYNIQCTVYSVHCTLCTVSPIVYPPLYLYPHSQLLQGSVQCIVYNVQYTVYSV